ncbi:MAG: exonuclease domain-containing protein [Aquimonas sp.]
MLYARRAACTPLARHYALPLPSLSTRWRDAGLLAVDFETSGLDSAGDRILSIGWVRIEGARIRMDSARHLLVGSTETVGQSATVHGLTDSDIADGLPLGEALQLLLTELEGRVLVSHGAPIELNFLAAACRRCFGLPPTLRYIDTLALERRIRRHEVDPSGHLRLHACRERYGLPTYRAHNAAIDALACAELLLAQVGRIGDVESLRLRDLAQ